MLLQRFRRCSVCHRFFKPYRDSQTVCLRAHGGHNRRTDAAAAAADGDDGLDDVVEDQLDVAEALASLDLQAQVIDDDD